MQFLQRLFKMQNEEKSKTKLKIFATSDTHASNQQLLKLIENKQSGDIFIHGGDFTRYGKDLHFQNFVSILQKLDFKHKIVIAGNHEVTLDQEMNPNHKQKKLQKYPCKYSRDEIIKMLQEHCTYLEHDFVQIEGIKIFGSPYTKKYGSSAFQYDKKMDQIMWSEVPKVDILLTHSPPYGILDKANSGKNVGSQALRKKVFEIKPKFHLFGHIHEAKGQLLQDGIQFINMAKQIIKVELEV